jgi:ubiquitin-protein ligase
MDPRDRRLEADARKVRELVHQSDLIDAVAVGTTGGRPPEVWEVTYRCRGIVGKNPDESPIYGEYHRVRIELGRDYPRTPPAFQWLTPILHPNIEGREPNRVCIDQAHWQPGQHLDAVILMMGEMVQYKNYHAEDSPPYPLDREAAAWARAAQAVGHFSKSRPVDPRPLLRPEGAPPGTTEPVASAPRRVRILGASAPSPGTARPSRVRLKGDS